MSRSVWRPAPPAIVLLVVLVWSTAAVWGQSASTANGEWPTYGTQYIGVAISGRPYSGELLAFTLPK